MLKTDYITKDYLDTRLDAAKEHLEKKLVETGGELQRFVFVTFVLAAIVQVLAVKLWH
jgi:hypothetical protein